MSLQPLVSCIMPTANRPRFVPQAIRYFLAQDYTDKELLILDDGEENIEDLVPESPQIRYIRKSARQTIGAKRNTACDVANGEIIVHWDDDDWSAPWRLNYQVRELLQSEADVCGLDRVLFVEPKTSRAWEYLYQRGGQPWVYGATLCYRKSFWCRNPFPAVGVGEDARFVWNARGARVLALSENGFYVGLIHESNTSPKQVSDPCWRPKPLAEVQNIMGREWDIYSAANSVSSVMEIADEPKALVSAAYGIGDILRITPLISVLHSLGYQVDVLLAPDYPETIELIRGAPAVNRLFYYPDIRRNRGTQPLPQVETEQYEIAAFTVWSAPFSRWIKAKVTHTFSQEEWLRAGDIASVEKIVRALGWHGPLPEPFALPSDRNFDLAPGTIALHPGCKPDWPWKKWHGFDELAGLFPQVVVIGSDSDLDNRGTYFNRMFEWPAHVKNFVGQLSLVDTGALIKQCVALVSNDSGLMQLGVALGVPTFGIFGITSPEREIIPSRWMYPITKGLTCEPACRRQAWGRRDCDRHLECLKSLSPQEVVERITEKLDFTRHTAPTTRSGESMDKISVNYYGYVFDATGYGQASRAYIHALHAAGVKVSVADIGSQPSQVQDDLVRSLIDKDPDADFQLFHGIPPQWAHLAYPLRNVIGVTVWETDSMPQRWRNPLTHAIDVWLPCTFNVEVFSRDLKRPAFRLPHVLLSNGEQEIGRLSNDLERLGVRREDFVFYSVFEWQDRKNPQGTIEAFIRAFPKESSAILLLKTNPGALTAANHTLAELRTNTALEGRVILCCEAWSEAQLHDLHNRGDCYVSLHKGEGWGYPLFEAVARGKPVVATGFSGPMDYLNGESHCLVRYDLAQVQQPYIYYQPTMHWAEPDIGHASEGMRQIYERRGNIDNSRASVADNIRTAHSSAAIGAMACARLMSLLRCTNRSKWERLMHRERATLVRPTLPIPGEWYDEGYFEFGLKSNWDQGYTWPLFKGVFEDTAVYLLEMFPEANTFLDVGCAKGFLVRALRERGKEAFGFDHSPWAIEHCEPSVRTYLTLRSAEEAIYERSFDVVTAFSVFEGLTEPQIDLVLRRARAWAKQALIAFIPTLTEVSIAGNSAGNGDLSHITLNTRDWWHQKFVKAKWRQDALHRIVERRCRSHSLPARMGWEIYVYAP